MQTQSSSTTSAVYTVCPNIDLQLQHKDLLIKSPSAVTFRQWVSSSWSNNVATFTCPPPNTTVFIDRCVLVGMPFTVVYGGTTTGSNILLNGYDALRAYPIASITNSSQVTINNQTFSLQTSDIIPYYARFWDPKHESTYPDMLDQFQEYNPNASVIASISNPLGLYYNTVESYEPRGAFPLVIAANTTTAATITGTIFEPLWATLLHKDVDDGLGLTNVKSMDVTINFNSNMARLVSHAVSAGVNMTSVAVTLGQPTLYMKYSTPPADYVPRPIAYGCDDLQRFITQTSAPLAPGATTQIISNNMQLNAVPDWIMVFCRESNSNLYYYSTDTATNISAVSIQFDNTSGILSSCTEQDLYNISKSNGFRGLWEDWHGVVPDITAGTYVGKSGSFMLLKFGKDIQLQPNTFPGKVGPYNIQLNVTVKNVSSVTTIAIPTLYIITSVPQKLIIAEGGSCSLKYGLSDVASVSEYVPYASAMTHYGGSFKDFMSKVGNFFRPIGDFLKSSKIVSSLLPLTNMIPGVGPAINVIATPIAQNLGIGEGLALGEGVAPHPRRRKAGEGGAKMTRRELLQELRKI